MALNLDYDHAWKPDAPTSAGPDFDFDPNWKPAPEPKGGLVASAKQAIGSTIKGAGQAAADFLPGVDQDNALKRYGQGVVDANPTAVSSLADLKDKPLTGIAEATGNAGGSMGAMLGARALGMGITAASPLAGPAAPLIAGLGQAVSWAGPAAAAALPSFGGIREKQIQDDPTRQDSVGSKLLAAAGAGTVGLIESKLGPNKWAEMALSKQGRDALAEKFVANSLAGSIAKGAAKGAAIEGAEEIAQNPIEQLASYQNPLTAENLKDTAFSGVMGALGGGVLGGASGAAFRGNHVTPTQQPAPTFDPAIQQQMLADQEQEALGINPADGPLSAVASTALHTGAAKTSAQIAIEQERQRMAEAMAQQDASESEIADATGAYDQAESQRQIRLAEEARRVEQEAKDKADFDTQWKQAQTRDDIRNVADQVLAEGAYEADQRKAAQSERMAQEPSLPFERIAPEDYDTLNPIKLGEGQLIDPVRPALPAPDSSRKALPNSQGGAPALGFTPQKPEPMRATADGQVGTPQQFDDLARTKATRKDQMRRAEDRVREMVQAGARMRGRDLVAPSGAVVMPNLTLLQAAKARQFTREAPNAQQDQSQPAPAQAVQAETQGSQQQPAVAPAQDLSSEAPLARPNIKESRNGTDNSLPNAEVAQKAPEGGGVVIRGGGNAVDARAGAGAEPKGRMPPESNPGVGQGALDANGEVAEQPNPAEPDSGLPDTRAGGSGERVAEPVSAPYKLPLNLRDKNAALVEMASLMGKSDKEVRESFSAMWKREGRESAEKRLVATVERWRAEKSPEAKQSQSPTTSGNSAKNKETSIGGKEFVHEGVRIYPIHVKLGGTIRQMWGVESAENKRKRENGERYGAGDSLLDTEEKAKEEATRQSKNNKESEIQSRKELAEKASRAEQDERKKNDNINGFLDGKAENVKGLIRKALSKELRFDGVVMSIRDRIEGAQKNGNLSVSTFEEPRIKPMSRTQFNRADNREQAAHEKKMRDAGNKTVYLVGESDLGKTAYDYAKHLIENGRSNAPAAASNLQQKESPASVSTESNPASANQNPIKTETRANAVPATETASANQEKAKSPSDLEALFSGLDSSSVRKANKAKKAAKAHPLADKIQNVQDNFLDILQELEDSGKVKINC